MIAKNGGQKLTWQQVLLYSLKRAKNTYDWLEEVDVLYKRALQEGDDAYLFASRLRILADAFAMYMTTLVTGGKNKTFSLEYCHPDKKWVADVKKMTIVRACQMNRHNRSGHESEHYGHFISAEKILTSNVKLLLDELELRILAPYSL